MKGFSSDAGFQYLSLDHSYFRSDLRSGEFLPEFGQVYIEMNQCSRNIQTTIREIYHLTDRARSTVHIPSPLRLCDPCMHPLK